jgi:hypothetical protein
VPCSPKSAHAGSKILPEKQELCLILFVREEVGPRVTDDYEPRQVREEAAVNNSICITKQSGLITFFYPKIITFFVQRRMHDQGIFPWSIQRYLFSKIQRNTNLTNHVRYVIIGWVFPISLKLIFFKFRVFL